MVEYNSAPHANAIPRTMSKRQEGIGGSLGFCFCGEIGGWIEPVGLRVKLVVLHDFRSRNLNKNSLFHIPYSKEQCL